MEMRVPADFATASVALVVCGVFCDPAWSGTTRAADQAFEAVALQAFMAPMFPQRTGGAFGSGPAGKHWQGLLTEQMAKQIAARGLLRLRSNVGASSGASKRGAGNLLDSANSGGLKLGPSCAAMRCARDPWQTRVVPTTDRD